MNFSETISKCILQVKKECPFFGALMLFAEIEKSESFSTAATDGKKIFFNEKFLLKLPSKQQNALFLHEVLHMALLHNQRRQSRDPNIWNIAADIVVNGLIKLNTPFPLPKGAILDNSFLRETADGRVEFQSVEQIYEKLLKKNKFEKYQLTMEDLLEEASEEDDQDLETYWKDKIQILQNSAELTQGSERGTMPSGMEAEILTVLEPEVDWRHALWKFVGKTPCDFDELDRRFMYRGLYLEGLLADALEVSVCIDTSGSVSDELLTQFMSELQGILRSYPGVKCDLFYADAEIYGPYELSKSDKIPKPKGFGGTSFTPFFDFLEKQSSSFNLNQKVSIYLTDGYGNFPDYDPKDPVMWVVCKDGLESAAFPFGEVVRISTEGF